jgi:hypothetical protein
MIVVPPLAVTDAILTSTTIAEPHAPSNYAGGTTYGVGAFATDATLFDVYQSLQPGNVGNTPSSSPTWWQKIGVKEVAYAAGTTYAASTATAPVYAYYNHRIYQSLANANTGNNPYASPTWWQDIGPTLRYAMFDTLRNTASVGASPLTVVLTPGVRVDTVAVLGVIADTVRVQITSGGAVVYDQTASLITRAAFNFYDYCFKPFIQSYAYLFRGLPPYSNGVVTVTFTRATGNAACGALCSGSATNLGITQNNPVRDALNFSTIARDNFGNSILTPRRSVPKTTQSVLADSHDLPNILAAKDVLNAVPGVWAGLTDNSSDYFPALLMLAVYKNFQITLQKPAKALIALELEEV